MVFQCVTDLTDARKRLDIDLGRIFERLARLMHKALAVSVASAAFGGGPKERTYVA